MGLVSFFLFVSLLWLMLHGIRRMLSRPRRSLSLEPFSVSRLFPSSASASASASSSAIWSNSRSGGSSLGTGLNRRRTVVAGSTRLHLTSLTLRLDTERLNALPHRALANLGAVPPSVHGQGTGTRRYSGILPLSAGDSSRITRQTNRLRKRRRMVEGFYDAGTLFAVCAMVFAILLLVLGAKQLVGKLGAVKDASSAVATAASGSGVDTCEDVGGVCAADFANAGTRTLRKRELGTGETNVGKTSSWGPDITPLIPGVTVPLSHLPHLLLALLFSQTIHEAGHALAGALSHLTPLSTGLLLLFPCLPGAYVVLPSAYLEPFTENTLAARERLRIFSAGVWHNFVTFGMIAVAVWAGLGQVLLGLGWRDAQGMVVRTVEEYSPLAAYLTPDTLITHLDDLSLDLLSASERTDRWDAFLLHQHEGLAAENGGQRRDQERYEEMGWCVERDIWEALPTTCCAKLDEPTSSTTTSNSFPSSLENHNASTTTSSSSSSQPEPPTGEPDTSNSTLCFVLFSSEPPSSGSSSDSALSGSGSGSGSGSDTPSTTSSTSTPISLSAPPKQNQNLKQKQQQKHSACLDPVPLISPPISQTSHAVPAQRCVDTCSPLMLMSGPNAKGDGKRMERECVRPDPREKLVRIGVRAMPMSMDEELTGGIGAGERAEVRIRTEHKGPEKQGRDWRTQTLLFQGDRSEVWRQIHADPYEARAWWIPAGLPRAASLFCGYILSLCLALALLNMLPLPHLDGDQILSVLLESYYARQFGDALHSSHHAGLGVGTGQMEGITDDDDDERGGSTMPGRGQGPEEEDRTLEPTTATATKSDQFHYNHNYNYRDVEPATPIPAQRPIVPMPTTRAQAQGQVSAQGKGRAAGTLHNRERSISSSNSNSNSASGSTSASLVSPMPMPMSMSMSMSMSMPMPPSSSPTNGTRMSNWYATPTGNGTSTSTSTTPNFNNQAGSYAYPYPPSSSSSPRPYPTWSNAHAHHLHLQTRIRTLQTRIRWFTIALSAFVLGGTTLVYVVL